MKKRVSMLAQFEIFQLFLHDLSCVDVFLCQNSLLAPTNLKKKKTIAKNNCTDGDGKECPK